MSEGAGPLVLGLHGWSQRNGWHTWEPLIAPWQRPASMPSALICLAGVSHRLCQRRADYA
jgi:hypothetical protein